MKVPGRSRFWMWLPFLQLLVSSEQPEGMAGPAGERPRGRGAAVPQRRPWVLDGCRRLSGLLRQKAAVLNKLEDAIRAVERDASLSDQEKMFQVHTLEIFQKELNESENSVFQAVHGLQRALQGDYRDVANMRESSRQRLEALREAAIKAEYVELLAAEKHQVEALKNMQHRNKSLSMLDEILEDVRRAADRLELEIEEHAFDDNKAVKGVNFEAVLRVEEEEADSQQNLSRREVEEDLGLSMLIDSQNNQYILTRPRDATIPRADHHLIKDIVSIVMLSLPCGWLCTTIGLPTMFGYIICGVLLGPSGLNSIKSIVQVETLGEFGVFFTLFLVGLEFSPEKLRKVWKISLQGPCYMTLLMVAFGLVWGHLLQIRPTQSVFISTCLSLSSTPLVSKFLVGSSRSDKEAGDIDYGALLLGMLVTQDVQLGLFIAILPTLIQAGAGAHASVAMEALRLLALVGQVVFSLAAVLLVCLLVRTYLVGPYCRKLHAESKGNKEILVLGISAFTFLMLTVTELLDVSMELGCFLAGALVSSQGHAVAEEVVSYVEPVRDFLAIVFFASIGLHVFPTFVLYELTVLLVLTLAVVVMKFVLAALVLSLLLPKTSQYVKWIVAAGLAQVSEFALVLGSRARRARVISREAGLIEANGELKVFIDQNLSPGKGVVSLVAVHPSAVNSLGKQLLPKTFGQSNVNIAQQVALRAEAAAALCCACRKRNRKGEKNGKGLRHFSMKVCEKVQRKGTTSYNEVADELVAEFSAADSHILPSESAYDQKNIRRRVYDALNVLMAMNIISKEKKEIKWIGLPTNSAQECQSLEVERQRRLERIKQKQSQLQELILQQIAFKNLVQRNRQVEQQASRPPPPNSVIHLPFIIVNTSKKTVIDCSISNDKFEYLFNFDNTFEIHDDIEVLKRMGMACGLESGSCSPEDLRVARSLVPKALEPYVTEMAQGSLGGVFVASAVSTSNGTRLSASDLANGADGALATSSSGSQYSGSRVETPVSCVGEDDEDDEDFNENEEED
ncbi:hypothetical protein G4228_017761 [Cervus hanglu yarkandensis]|nr:hypothetical protein G4228_017761 [Cervus hanglu yarkandensis]